MTFPAVRERVVIEGGDEVFLVVSVDRERAVADLIPLSEGGSPQEDLAALRRLKGHSSFAD